MKQQKQLCWVSPFSAVAFYLFSHFSLPNVSVFVGRSVKQPAVVHVTLGALFTQTYFKYHVKAKQWWKTAGRQTDCARLDCEGRKRSQNKRNLQRLKILRRLKTFQEMKAKRTTVCTSWRGCRGGGFTESTTSKWLWNYIILRYFRGCRGIKAAWHQQVTEARHGFRVWGACRGWALQEDWKNAAFYVVEALLRVHPQCNSVAFLWGVMLLPDSHYCVSLLYERSRLLLRYTGQTVTQNIWLKTEIKYIIIW